MLEPEKGRPARQRAGRPGKGSGRREARGESSAHAPSASAPPRPAHRLERGFDMPPGLSALLILLPLQGDGALRGFGDGAIAMRLDELTGILGDHGLVHGRPDRMNWLGVVLARSRHREPVVERGAPSRARRRGSTWKEWP